MLTERLNIALSIALQAHPGETRKGTRIPYVSHLLAVAAIALEHGADEDQAMAALLHDAIEDGGARYAPLIRQQCGDRVADMVEGCTDGVPNEKGVKEEWKTRKLRYLAHLTEASSDVLMVSGADKLHNACSIVEDQLRTGAEVFDRFNASKEETLWYYQSLAQVFTLRGAPVARVLNETVQRMVALAA
jgi:(p)ppGpp synthase/HD superfamily hydrolase